MVTRSVYRFHVGFADADKSMKTLVGGKGAGLAEMCRANLNVPPGFTIAVPVCAETAANAGRLPAHVQLDVDEAIRFVEKATGKVLGDPKNPLLLSVRSGAAISMPGMMDTVLDLGMNDEVVEGLAELTGRPIFAWDCYRRFVDVFSNVVLGVPHEVFEHHIDAMKRARGVSTDQELSVEDLRILVAQFKASAEKHTKEPFPSDPRIQLSRSIAAVFRSWFSERALKYREVQHIVGLAGTAVNIQAMVYGNYSDNSGTGVLFTRNPSTGEKGLYGEYLIDAQGEDVVSGSRTPQSIFELEREMPSIYAQLKEGVERLERHYKNMQDIEFTVQDGTLFFLQCRNGKRTGAAALKIAVDFAREGLVTTEEAVYTLVGPEHIEQVLHPCFKSEDDYRKEGKVVAKGLPASPGAAIGRAVFTAAEAEAWTNKGEHVILIRIETSPKDIAGVHAARGILTGRGEEMIVPAGGMTSHAAVVARGWGKPCVAGCGAINVDEENCQFTVGTTIVRQGDWISLNGTTGEVILGKSELRPAVIGGDLETVLGWADRIRRLGIRTNIDNPADARLAKSFGAEGAGLVRTERMFAAESRIVHVRRMILATDDDERNEALKALIEFQRSDFSEILEAMEGLPVTVRLLDPPLHEFLPTLQNELEALAGVVGKSVEHVKARAAELHEFNPMLGHRGCRLGITTPDVTRMQVRALFEAICTLRKAGRDANLEVMVPLVGHPAELRNQKEIVHAVANEVMSEMGVQVPVIVGTMIEVPRACIEAGKIAKEADFFSFGTNDLTQMTFGFSRDDAGSFLQRYVALGILPDDPFQTIDESGVGELVEMAVKRGRAVNPSLLCGVCGEVGGDPKSIAFFNKVGLDYVSCSTFRVPVARLAAAQAVVAQKTQHEHHN